MMPRYLRTLPLLMISVAVPAFAVHHKKPVYPSRSPLTPDQQAIHALDRLTFGPRPGDVEKVKAMGVDVWIDQQLHPSSIDDAALAARLSSYPATQLTAQKRIEMFPPPPVIRALENGRMTEPQSGFEHAIYADQLERIQMRQQARQAKQSAGSGQPVMTSPQNDKDSPSIAAQEDRLYRDLDSVKIVNLPPDQRVDRIVAMKPEEADFFFRSLNPQERQALGDGLTPQQRESLLALDNPMAMVSSEAMVTRLLRDIYSERQLQAVMVDFWLNHFNVYLRKNQLAPWYLANYENEVILPHAMGRFEDLLDAVAQSPAMLDYLDNASSTGPHSPAAMRASLRTDSKKPLPGINENYGRELMELHTLGVNGGYTQQDVIEVAKAFTGWTVERPAQGGGFAFEPNRHEPGTKIVLGHRIDEAGEQEGLEVLHILANSPATAHFLSLELAQRFVSDNPPRALVDRMAATYMKTHGQISEVLRTMLRSPEFWSESAYRAKVKTPEEFVLSAVRATGGEVARPEMLVAALNKLGMPLYGCQTPNGYSWQSATWVNTGDLLNRMNFALALADNHAGTEVDYSRLLNGSTGGSPEAMENALENSLLSDGVSPQTRTALLQQVDKDSTQPIRDMPASFTPPRGKMMTLTGSAPLKAPADPQAAAIAGLLIGSPDFQRR